MHALSARVARTLTRARLLSPGDRVAVALSGGSDSVALTLLLRRLAPEFGVTIAGLIHDNHLWRGAASDEDEAFCRSLAARLEVPIDIARIDVAGLARDRGWSIEVAARHARYATFSHAAARLNATLVATGHTEDDQAETVLLRLLRGAGARGVSGIRPRRGIFIRPLLQCRRADLRHFLTGRGEAWRDDASNADTSILRNRLRHDAMPVLQGIAPGAVRALARFAALANDDETFLNGMAIEHLARLVAPRTGASRDDAAELVLDGRTLSALAAPIGRRVVRLAVATVAPAAGLSARHLEAVCRLAATDKPEGRIDLPGLVARKEGSRLCLAARDGAGDRRRRSAVWAPRELAVPGSVTITEAGLTLEACVGDAAQTAAGPDEAMVPAGSVALPLVVRNRRPGDRFQPLGAPGRRKLQDVLVDRKVPRHERDSVPVVTDASGAIVWVAGVALAESCRVRPAESGVLLLRLRKHQ